MTAFPIASEPPRAVRTLPLRRLTARELRPLLEEEAAQWRSELLWDFADVAAAVAAGLDRGTLLGRFVDAGSGPLAYCYYVREPGRAVVGSVFSSVAARGRGYEAQLVDDVVADARDESGEERLECQTLFCSDAQADARFARAGFVGRERHYLVRELALDLPEAPAAEVRLRRLGRVDLPLAAQVIHDSHRGSIDAALNLTYATPAHCRAFVDTLVLRAGCGSFDPEASFVAEHAGRAVAVLLASQLSQQAGHVCQVSVEPASQQRGIGEALLLAALAAFRSRGLSHASLSVTVDNRGAYRLYERLGFRLRRAFAAHAWLRPPGRLALPL